MIKDLRQDFDLQINALVNYSPIFNYIEIIGIEPVKNLMQCLPIFHAFPEVTRFFFYLPTQDINSVMELLEEIENPEVVVLTVHEDFKSILLGNYPAIFLTDGNELLSSQQQALRYILAGKDPEENGRYDDEDYGDIALMETELEAQDQSGKPHPWD